MSLPMRRQGMSCSSGSTLRKAISRKSPFTSSPSSRLPWASCSRNGYGPSSRNTICCTGGRSLFSSRRFSCFFSGLHGLGDVGYSRQHPGFLRLRRTSGKLQESQRAQRGDDHVYRQSPQRYRADIPLCPHTRPRYKENHPQLLRKSSSFFALGASWEPPCPPSSLKKPFCSAASSHHKRS